jgi:hypothetical protein
VINLNDHPSIKVRFNKDFQKVENSEFIAGSVLIAYEGENRNGSDITKEAFEAADKSLGLIPIVGHWLAEKQNFGGHDAAIEWNGNELVFKDNTVPYGVVRENHNATWVEIEDNGVKHNYRKADCVLWAGRYQQQIDKVVDDGCWQSMEINVGEYKIKENGKVQIDKFEYSALCMLGKDVDESGKFGEDNVEPCFESSTVVISDEFKSQFSLMVDEMKKTFSVEAEVVVPVVEHEVITDALFSVTVNQKREALYNDLENEVIKDAEGNIIKETYYWICDFDDEVVYVERSIWTKDNYESERGRFKYTFNEEAITASIDKSSWEKMIMVWLTEEENQKIQDERSQYELQIATLTTENESLKTTNAELQEYKKSNEFEQDKTNIESLVESFESELAESDEFKVLKENITASFEKHEIFMNYENLDKELFAMVGRKKFTVSPKKIVSRVAITELKQDKKDKSEFGSAEKYFKGVNDE